MGYAGQALLPPISLGIRRGEVIPANADLVIVPGSKSTIADLELLRAQLRVGDHGPRTIRDF